MDLQKDLQENDILQNQTFYLEEDNSLEQKILKIVI